MSDPIYPEIVEYSASYLHGRRRIYTAVEEITEENIVQIVNEALITHALNAYEEKYLKDYRRGIAPILWRTKERNTFVCNRIVENHAEEIVQFKDGYFLGGQPCSYVARRQSVQGKVNKLNEFLYRSGKGIADNRIVDSFHTVGKGVLYVEPGEDDEVPVRCYDLDPLSAFVIYSLRPGRKPMVGVTMVVDNKTLYIDAYTKDFCYRIIGTPATGMKVVNNHQYPNGVAVGQAVYRIDPNPIGEIPIIEYSYNSLDLGAFEAVIPLLDAINEVASNRVDGVEQFIQSLLVIYGADLPEGETADTMKSKGILVLPRMGDGTQADVKILSEELNQQQTQTLVDWMYKQVLTICSMPSTLKGSNSTSDTATAVYLRDGYANASVCARNTEDLFRDSNAQFDVIFLKILERKGLVKGLKVSDFELNFVRNETSGMYEKAQALSLLLSSGVEPTLAFGKSGVSSDPNADVKMSEKWLKMKWGDPDAPAAAKQAITGENGAEGEPLESETVETVTKTDNKMLTNVSEKSEAEE